MLKQKNRVRELRENTCEKYLLQHNNVFAHISVGGTLQ